MFGDLFGDLFLFYHFCDVERYVLEAIISFLSTMNQKSATFWLVQWILESSQESGEIHILP